MLLSTVRCLWFLRQPAEILVNPFLLFFGQVRGFSGRRFLFRVFSDHLAEGLDGDAKSLAEQLAQAAEAGEITDAKLQAMMSGQQNPSKAGALQ